MELTPCIDIGANLAHRSFQQDISDVVYAAVDAGVVAMIVTGTSVDASRNASRLSANFPGVLFATAGVHPHEAKSWAADSSAILSELLAEPQVVALGECGLDYHRNFSPPDQQIACFEQQLELASQFELPLFLHERGAHPDFLAMVQRWRDRLADGVVHCFTGTRAELHAYLDLDFYIGVTGWICDERRGGTLRELVREVPADRLLLETDAPYLAPRDLPAKVHRNEPKYLPHILAAVAAQRSQPAPLLAEIVLENTRRCFGLGDHVGWRP